jgi:hypothetical protein
MFLLVGLLMGYALYCYSDYAAELINPLLTCAKRKWFDLHVKYPEARWRKSVPFILTPLTDAIMKLDREMYDLDFSTVPKHRLKIVEATLYSVENPKALLAMYNDDYLSGDSVEVSSPVLNKKRDVTDLVSNMWKEYNSEYTARIVLNTTVFDTEETCVLSVRYLSNSHKCWGGRGARESQHIYILFPESHVTFPPTPSKIHPARAKKVMEATYGEEVDVTSLITRLAGPRDDFYKYTDDPHTTMKINLAIAMEHEGGGALTIEFC